MCGCHSEAAMSASRSKRSRNSASAVTARAEDLQRVPPGQSGMLRQVDLAHPPGAQEPDDRVARKGGTVGQRHDGHTTSARSRSAWLRPGIFLARQQPVRPPGLVGLHGSARAGGELLPGDRAHRLAERPPHGDRRRRPRAAVDVPSASASGTRQFGYSSVVPGWFCVRRSPTASVSASASSRDGVRPR